MVDRSIIHQAIGGMAPAPSVVLLSIAPSAPRGAEFVPGLSSGKGGALIDA